MGFTIGIDQWNQIIKIHMNRLSKSRQKSSSDASRATIL
jgi:hypothetical protein